MSEPQERRVSRRRSRAEADRLAQKFEQSGMTRRAFCQQHDLPIATLDNYRKRRASSKAAPSTDTSSSLDQPSITFVPLEVVEPRAAARSLIVPREAVYSAALFVELSHGRRMFLFANKRRDRMKILFFDGNSLWVCARRMEQGCLHWPASAEGRAQLSREEFALLIGGIDPRATTPRKWFRKPVEGDAQNTRKTA
jgi:transposase